MTIPADIIDTHPQLGNWAILTAYRGSIVHGTHMDLKDEHSTDDRDVMAICVPPKQYYIGMEHFGLGDRGTREIKRGEWDIVVYECRKAIRLLAGGNPNILMLLWLPQNAYIKRTPAADTLIQHRSLFDGKHVYRSFVGYARGQMRRMTHGVREGYMGEKRKALFEKYGYDTKNASHTIRLLRMAVEYLSTGELHVLRHDASELIDIKRGRWTLAEVEAEAQRLFALADQALVTSHLPPAPDMKRISDLCVGLVQQGWQQIHWEKAQ